MDPLRPFVSLLGSLWRPDKASTARAGAAAVASRPTRNETATSAAGSQEALRLRLRNRIAETGLADEKRVRDTFVATVLAWQFGAQVESDPQFGEIVSRLSNHIGSKTALRSRLQELMRALANE